MRAKNRFRQTACLPAFSNPYHAFPMSRPNQVVQLARLLAVSLSLPASLAQAAPSYSAGDILLGFRAGSDPGANQNYVVNLGPASQFASALDPFVVSDLSGVGADLTNTFSEETPWHQRGDVFWGIAGTDLASDPANTLYVSRPRSTPGSQSLPWDRRPSGTQSGTNSVFRAFISGFLNSASNATSPRATLQPASSANSYAFFTQPGVDFSAYAGIEGSFTNGAAQSVLDLYRLTPLSQTQGTLFVGSFAIDTAGNLTFTPPEPSAPRFRIQSSSYSSSENAGTLVVRVIRSGPSSGTDTVQIAAQDGTAQSATDYTFSASTLTFNPGETEKDVSVTVVNRPGIQASRSFQIALSGASAGATVGVPGSATATIQDVSSVLQFSSATYSVDEAAGTLAIQVLRTGVTTRTDTVQLDTAPVLSGEAAVPGTDYTAQNNVTVTFNPGDSTKTVSIPIVNRPGSQPNRAFLVQLSSPSSNASLGSTGTATATITSLQPGVVNFSQSRYSGAEPATASTTANYAVTVNRSGGSDGAVTAVLRASGGTATVTTDYELEGGTVSGQAINRTLSWAAGESGPKTVNVRVKKDPDNTPADTLSLQLLTPTGGLELGTASAATFTITEREDNTGPVIRITEPVAKQKIQSQSGPATVTLKATATDLVGVSSVTARVNGGSAIAVPLVTGIYTVPITGLENGASTIELTATDERGNISRASVAVDVSIVDPNTVGAYNGLFVADAEEDAKLAALVNGPSLNHNGLLRVDVTAGQRFTGTVTMAGISKIAIKGIFLSDGSAVFGDGETASDTVELIKKGTPDDFSLGFLSLRLDKAGRKITGELTTDRSESPVVTFAEVSADQSLYKDGTVAAPFQNVPSNLLNPATDKGNYTVLFQNKPAPNNGYAQSAYPLGDGAGTLVLSPKGTVTVVARLADGSAVSYSNALSLQNRLPLYVQLYANRGFIVGNVQFDPTRETSDASATVSWFRPSGITATKNYVAGWKKGLDLDLIASKYAPAAAGKNLLGLDPTAVLHIRTQGALRTTLEQGDITAANAVRITTGVSGQQRATGLKVTIDTKTGLLKAPSEFLYGTGAVKVSLVGAVFQKAKTVQGHFLYSPAAVNPVGTAESGYFEIQQPAAP